MIEKNLAFESGAVSIAFIVDSGLGDAVITKKIFSALVELAPDCLVDIFCLSEGRKAFAKAFYSDSKNLNLILNLRDLYEKYVKNYDLSFHPVGYNFINLYNVNFQKLSLEAPKLLEAIVKINEYNKRFVQRAAQYPLGIILKYSMSAQILNKNLYYFISCGGALPIHDDYVEIKLAPEYKQDFDNLKLGNYITIYSDIAENEKDQPKVKTWPMRYLIEYVARMKKRFPEVEIVQCGGGEDVKIGNADRHYLGIDLELTKYILANSLLLVGCEGGLIHLATALGTKCLVLFGPSSRYYYGYDRNINLVSEICQPCMYIWGDGGINICMRGNREPPCMLSHTPQNVCEVTCNYLNRLDLENKA